MSYAPTTALSARPVPAAAPTPREHSDPTPCVRCREPGVTVVGIRLEDGTSVTMYSCDHCDTRSWIYGDEMLDLAGLTERLRQTGVAR